MLKPPPGPGCSALDTVQSFADSVQKVIADANKAVQDSFVGILQAQKDLNAATAFSGNPEKIASRPRKRPGRARMDGGTEVLGDPPEGVMRGHGEGLRTSLLQRWSSRDRRRAGRNSMTGSAGRSSRRTSPERCRRPNRNKAKGVDRRNSTDQSQGGPRRQRVQGQGPPGRGEAQGTRRQDLHADPGRQPCARQRQDRRQHGEAQLPSASRSSIATLDANNNPANTKTTDSTNRVGFSRRNLAAFALPRGERQTCVRDDPRGHGCAPQSFERYLHGEPPGQHPSGPPARHCSDEERPRPTVRGSVPASPLSRSIPPPPVATPYAGTTTSRLRPASVSTGTTNIYITLPPGAPDVPGALGDPAATSGQAATWAPSSTTQRRSADGLRPALRCHRPWASRPWPSTSWWRCRRPPTCGIRRPGATVCGTAGSSTPRPIWIATSPV